MVNRWHYIAWHTPDNYYRSHSEQMVNSVWLNGRKPIVVRGYEEKGGWESNNLTKPYFILDELNNTEDDVVYLDVDSRVCQYPELFDTIQEDFALHYRNDVNVFNCVIFVKNTKGAREILHAWIERQNELYPDALSEQTGLHQVLYDRQHQVCRLPGQYAQIWDSMADYGNPVIKQMQASRLAHNHHPAGMEWKNR